MIRKIVEYEDLDGNVKTETLYFYLTTKQLADMEMSARKGGKSLSTMLREVMEAKDSEERVEKGYDLTMDLLEKSYGVRTEDGKGTRKDPETTKVFMDSMVFEALFKELLYDPKAMEAFITGIFPSHLIEEARKQRPVMEVKLPDPENTIRVESLRIAEKPAWERENRMPTRAEFEAMSREEMMAYYAGSHYRASQEKQGL